MEIVDTNTMQWSGGAEHRSGGVMFKTMFAGEPGAPGNYWYTLVRISEYHAPTHRHNFDQVRYMLDGRFGFGDAVQEEGSVGYFTEGLPYTQTVMGHNVHLLLQCEGGSRSQYLSPEQVKQAAGELAKIGSFDGGRYTAPEPGSTPIDGFEAVWQHVVGKPVSYPDPRYGQPIIMDPERFAYVTTAQSGLSHRSLGRFTERGIEMNFCKIQKGSTIDLPPIIQKQLIFVCDGRGSVWESGEAEQRSYVKHSAIRVSGEESISIFAIDETHLFCIYLPN